MNGIEYETKRIDHLGIVAGICKAIGLVEIIDRIVGPTARKVSVGQAALAMLLNGLGFVSRALYLTPEFWSNKPVDRLIGEGIEPADLNDDSLGRALDRLYEAGPTAVFSQVVQAALKVYPYVSPWKHLDSSTFSFYGQYQNEQEGDESGSEPPRPVHITQGYSKDGRPDLKQVSLSLICSSQSAIPTWLSVLDGNQSDKENFPKIIQAYVEQMEGADNDYFIADSAFYTQKNIQALANILWLTRVPATLKAVQQLYQQVSTDEMQPAEADERYRYLELGNWYGGVRQRWLLVFSQPVYESAVATLEKQIEQERVKAEKALAQLAKQTFDDPLAAIDAWQSLQQSWRYHFIESDVLTLVPHYDTPGRPRKDQLPDRVTWQISGQLVADEEAIAQAKATKGKFVLATNELDPERLPAEEMLTAYKQEGISSERGFRFLKDPLFFADGLFLEKEERIMALLMIMGLCLLVYALAEHHLRAQLAEQNETLPDQKGKPTQRLTLRRVFQMFEGIDILLIRQEQTVQQKIMNLEAVHIKILDLLGPDIRYCYLPDI